MNSIPTHLSINARLNYFLFERFGASEVDLRKYYMYSQVGFLVAMLSYLFDDVVANVPILSQLGYTGILFWLILTIVYFFVKEVRYLLLVKEIGLQVIVFYFVYHTGGLLTCGGIILMGIIPVLTSLVFRNLRWMILSASAYFLSVSYLAITNKSLSGKELISSDLNLIFFAITLLVVTSFIFVFALYAQRIYTNLERKEAERQKEISDAKTRLYTNITHEFRTPLTVILGLADAVKTNWKHSSPEKMDIIIKNGKNLLQLVDQMLDLSKLESGKLSVNKINANAIPFLKYVFQLQEFYAEEKSISMHFTSESQSYAIEFDPEKLASIVTNLLSNAIKFTPDGGQIYLKVFRANENICIEIKDNGIGIPPEKLDTIFDRFYQVNDQTTRKEGGAGIGLAITRELVELMDGKIEVKSNPGIGTAFTVKLPYIEASKETTIVTGFNNDTLLGKSNIESDDIHSNALKTKPRLLIIEDNPDVVGYLHACYQSHYSIQTATNGMDGYKIAMSEIPDIIISDVMMPQMDGFELCKKLKEDFKTSHIPIILLTARADIPSRIEGLETGADAYVIKPFNQRELLVRMQKLLELRKNLFRRYRSLDQLDNSNNPLLQKEDLFMKKINEIIFQNISDEYFNIQVLCDKMAMSKSQLYRKFNALTNFSAAKYIRTLRMKKAKELLETTSMNITEVGYEVGMKSVSVFSKLFKEEYGCSPTKFIERHS